MSGFGDIFIVDNSAASHNGLQLLRGWSKSARTLDMATGYFDVGVFLSLDGNWQSIDKIRIIIGDESTKGTLESLQALGKKVRRVIEDSLEEEKQKTPTLREVHQLLAAIKKCKVEIRVFNKGKFHAKAYLPQFRQGTNVPQSLVGSSNFTMPGLTRNIELNVRIDRKSEVEQLARWFEEHWHQSDPINDNIVLIIEKHLRNYTPFEVYAKAMQALFSSFERPSASAWEEDESMMFPKLDRYQQEAYWALMRIAQIHNGAFLCDGVGLGKTFVGLMLIERLVSRDRKNVALFAPKTALENVWIPHLSEHVPTLGGTSGLADLSNLVVYSHTDFNRRTMGFPGVFDQIANNVDIVIVDEAHHFRNPGSKVERKGRRPSRYQMLYKLLDPSKRRKTLYLLTATPICNSLDDFRHMTELITRRNPSYFSKTIGISNFNSYIRKTEKQFFEQYQTETEQVKDAKDILSSDRLIGSLVVQRSRKYARESQKREHGRETAFPKRDKPKVVNYSIVASHGNLLQEFKRAFDKTNPLFTLPMYSPLRWYIGEDADSLDKRMINSQEQVIGLVRTMFIKRFESSIEAFEASCMSMLAKLLRFIGAHEALDSQRRTAAGWKESQVELMKYLRVNHPELGDDEIYEDDELVPDVLHGDVERLNPKKYDIDQMIDCAWDDVEQIVVFLEMTRRRDMAKDDKAQKLIRLIKSDKMRGQKVLVFTEYAQTAKYLLKVLTGAGFDDVVQFDGSSNLDRKAVIKRFAPYYNNETPESLKAKNQDEINILISTDVLSEGLNLQDATMLVNFDIHWSPVRLMQRIGRVDRRMDPAIEKKIKSEATQEVVSSRGRVSFWNFLPPDELDDILTLYRRVSRKTLLISRTFGIEEKQLLTPDDDYDPLKEFNEAYEGNAHTDLEKIHIEYQKLLRSNPGLESRLNNFPKSVLSGKEMVSGGIAGLFFCFSLPIYDEKKDEFIQDGVTRWYLYDAASKTIIAEPVSIIGHIRSKRSTLRKRMLSDEELRAIRKEVVRHIDRTYLKKVGAPRSSTPELVCWLELNA